MITKGKCNISDSEISSREIFFTLPDNKSSIFKFIFTFSFSIIFSFKAMNELTLLKFGYVNNNLCLLKIKLCFAYLSLIFKQINAY